jgi:hypothetical protein
VPNTYDDHPFTIGPNDGDARVVVDVTWADPTNDWDLYLLRKESDGSLDPSSTARPARTFETGQAEETVNVPNPQAGNYVIRVINSTATGTFNTATTFTQRTGDHPVADPQHRLRRLLRDLRRPERQARSTTGIATSVGGTWHRAAAIGLPKRFITSVKSDPTNANTVYVTLAGYSRRWMVPGAMGEGGNLGTGNVFKSTDAGEHFTNISGNLPDGPAESTIVYGGNLIVGTDTGVYISKGTNGGTYQLLGTGLPNVPVFTMGLKPKATSSSPNVLYIATHGRGIYTYQLS